MPSATIEKYFVRYPVYLPNQLLYPGARYAVVYPHRTEAWHQALSKHREKGASLDGRRTVSPLFQVATQLGLLDDAVRLYRECGRYDLLNRLYQVRERGAVLA